MNQTTAAHAFAQPGQDRVISPSNKTSKEDSISRLGSTSLGSHLGAVANEIRSLDIRAHELRERLAPILKDSETASSVDHAPSDLLYPDCPLAVVAAELHSSLLGLRLNLDSLLRDLAI